MHSWEGGLNEKKMEHRSAGTVEDSRRSLETGRSVKGIRADLMARAADRFTNRVWSRSLEGVEAAFAVERDVREPLSCKPRGVRGRRGVEGASKASAWVRSTSTRRR
jgi:hypothetical protein